MGPNKTNQKQRISLLLSFNFFNNFSTRNFSSFASTVILSNDLSPFSFFNNLHRLPSQQPSQSPVEQHQREILGKCRRTTTRSSEFHSMLATTHIRLDRSLLTPFLAIPRGFLSSKPCTATLRLLSTVFIVEIPVSPPSGAFSTFSLALRLGYFSPFFDLFEIMCLIIPLVLIESWISVWFLSIEIFYYVDWNLYLIDQWTFPHFCIWPNFLL